MSNWFATILGPTVAKSIDSLKDDLITAVRGEIVKYAPQLIDLAQREFEKYFPQLLELAREQLEKYGPQLVGMAREELHAQFEEWLPILVTGVTQAGIHTAAALAVKGEDALTNAIPGTLDDKIIDPIFKNVMGTLQTVFSADFHAAFPPAP